MGMIEENEMDGYIKIDRYNEEKIKSLANSYTSILEEIGEDPKREGLLKTPERVAKALQYLTHGYDLDPGEILKGAMFKEDYSQMVIVKDITFASVCEHHLAPFVGKVHIAYIPKNGRIVGLSKLARIAEIFSHRLQVQERLTQQIAQTLFDELDPVGVMVVMEAEHTCMTLRGVKKPGSKTITSAVLGGFRKDARTRAEAMSLIKG